MRVTTRITLALTLRGICRACSFSTGADSTSANREARANGTNAACATYRRVPIAPQTRIFSGVNVRTGDGSALPVSFDDPFDSTASPRIFVIERTMMTVLRQHGCIASRRRRRRGFETGAFRQARQHAQIAMICAAQRPSGDEQSEAGEHDDEYRTERREHRDAGHPPHRGVGDRVHADTLDRHPERGQRRSGEPQRSAGRAAQPRAQRRCNAERPKAAPKG